jgi:hypothetical protein
MHKTPSGRLKTKSYVFLIIGERQFVRASDGVPLIITYVLPEWCRRLTGGFALVVLFGMCIAASDSSVVSDLKSLPDKRT